MFIFIQNSDVSPLNTQKTLEYTTSFHLIIGIKPADLI